MTSAFAWTRDRRFELRDGLVRRGALAGSVSATRLVDLQRLERLRRRHGGTLSYEALLARAVAEALAAYPAFNRVPVVRPGWRRLARVNGVHLVLLRNAVFPDGTPARPLVLKCVDIKTVTAIEAALKAPPERAPELAPAFLPRMLALWWATLHETCPRMWLRRVGGAAAVSCSPQDGADVLRGAERWPVHVHLGAVRRRPAVVRGRIVPRASAHLTVQADARLASAAEAEAFLRRVSGILSRAAFAGEMPSPEIEPLARAPRAAAPRPCPALPAEVRS